MSIAAKPRPIRAALRVALAPVAWIERTRGVWRSLLLLTYAAIAATVGLFARRATSLCNLPDAGDPFDVAAFSAGRESALPESEDAFPLYAQAVATMRYPDSETR